MYTNIHHRFTFISYFIFTRMYNDDVYLIEKLQHRSGLQKIYIHTEPARTA
jgi:hypothetical protein